MDRLSPQEWIAIASHRLSQSWHHVGVEQLDEVAEHLYRDDALRRLEPTAAAEAWLAPLDTSVTCPR